MLQIPAATIAFPRVQYSGNGSVDLKEPQWNLMGKQFLRKQTVSMRYFVLFDERISQDTMDRYPNEFATMVNRYKTGTYTDCGWTFITPDKSGVDYGLQMADDNKANFVLLILQEKDISVYSDFKNQADRRYGFHSLCVTEKPNMRGGRLSPKLAPYFGNVMMKSNLKAGGTNHSVDGVSGILKDTLVLGADVTHANKGALYGTPSIAAVVGSVDELGGKFLGSMRLQAKRDLNPAPKSEGSADEDNIGKNDTEVSISFLVFTYPFPHNYADH